MGPVMLKYIIGTVTLMIVVPVVSHEAGTWFIHVIKGV